MAQIKFKFRCSLDVGCGPLGVTNASKHFLIG